MAKRKAKIKIDGGLDADTIKKLRGAIRQVWSWSHSRKVCIARATDKEGFGRCEKCKKKVAKLFADHIEVMGDIRGEKYLDRMWCASTELQALCKKCHDAKTKDENRERAYFDAGL